VVTLDGVAMFGRGENPISELEALLGGTYVEHLERRGCPVPSWAWINLLAHGSDDDLRSAARARPRPFLNVNLWRHARSYLAGEVLGAADRTGSLAVLQAVVLVPRELADLATPSSRRIRPGQWATGVLAAVEDYQRVTRRPPPDGSPLTR
jgi:hypothetical protein